VFYVPDLAKKNWSVLMPGKKVLWGLKMLLRRRNTTSLMKFHPLTLQYKPQLMGTNKIPYLQTDHSEKSIYRNQGKKASLISAESFL
jgi:hypothetical protein